MDSRVLRTFIEVAHHGSFAAAARSIDMDPSLVSRAIAGLEGELGLRLFQRTTRQMTLTEAGALYMRRIEAVLDELDHARDEALAVSSGPRGTLRITASVAFGMTCLTPLIGDFRAAFPEVRLDLALSDENLDLVAEGIDLAIRLAPSIESDVICAKLFDTRYRVCASPDYISRAAPFRTPGDISHHDTLLFSLPGFRSRWLFRGPDGDTIQAPVSGGIMMSNALAIRTCMLAGLGPALLPDWLICEAIAAGRCVDVYPGHEVTATSFATAAWLIYPSRRFLPDKVRVAVDFLRSRLPPRPDRLRPQRHRTSGSRNSLTGPA